MDVTEGRTDGSVTIFLRNFVGEGIIQLTYLVVSNHYLYTQIIKMCSGHDIAEILLQLALIVNQSINQSITKWTVQ